MREEVLSGKAVKFLLNLEGSQKNINLIVFL